MALRLRGTHYILRLEPLPKEIEERLSINIVTPFVPFLASRSTSQPLESPNIPCLITLFPSSSSSIEFPF